MSRKHIPYFNFYPTDFMNGVRGLSPQDVGVYTMILCRIYEESGPVEYHVRRLATYCGMREATFDKVMRKLVDLGKLTLHDGVVSNGRSEVEIEKRANDLKIASRAGKASAAKRQQNQGKAATTVQRPFNHTDTDTEEERPKGLLSFPSNDDLETAIDDYNDSAEKAGWPKVKALTKARAAALKARLRECGGLAGWRAALARARASPHLCGQNERGWTASFDFLTAQSSFSKLMEGNYDARPSHQNAGPAAPGGQRPDPAVEQISRIVRSRHASGPGGAGAGGSGEKD